MILGGIYRESKGKNWWLKTQDRGASGRRHKEVVPEGLKVLDAVAARFDIGFQWDHFDWSCDYYAKHGKMMPDDWRAQIGQHEAIFFGSIGWPATVPDHEALWGSLFKFRREFDQYINLRPVRRCPCLRRWLIASPEIDFYIVRENTEGEYSNSGGRLFEGTEREVVIQESVFTRVGADRVLKFAFDLAQKRGKHLTAPPSPTAFPSRCLGGTRVADIAKAIPTCAGTSTISISCALISCSIPTGSMSWWHPTCLAISCRTWVRPARHHRHRAVGQPESRAQVPIPVRARARFGARHLRQGHRQSDRPDLERRADAGFPGLSGGIRRRRERDRDRAGGRTAHPDMQGTASTAEVGDAISSLISAR